MINNTPVILRRRKPTKDLMRFFAALRMTE